MARGFVRKRSGSWYAIYPLYGKKKWEKGGRRKIDAERLLARRIDEINSGDFHVVSPIVFEEFTQKWLDDYARVHVKESTYDSYETILRKHLIPVFGKRRLESIRTDEIQSFISGLVRNKVVSPKTAVNILVPLREMFKHAKLWGFVRRDPTEGVKRPMVVHKEMDFLTANELSIFLQNVNPKFYAFFATAGMTGMRRGELVALTWEDINWYTSEIFVNKSIYKGRLSSPKTRHSRRRVAMSPRLKDILYQHRIMNSARDIDFVFASCSGKPLIPENVVTREFHPTLERAGLRRIRFHDLRHTYASIMIASGVNIKFIQNQLGHSSAKITLDTYGHLMPGVENDAGMRLDNAVFNSDGRKMVENPLSKENPTKNKTPEVVELQELNLGSGGRI